MNKYQTRPDLTSEEIEVVPRILLIRFGKVKKVPIKQMIRLTDKDLRLLLLPLAKK